MLALKQEIGILLIVIFAGLVGTIFITQSNDQSRFNVNTQIPNPVRSSAMPTPTPRIAPEKQTSSDGKMQLTMRAQLHMDKTKTYYFVVSSISDSNQPEKTVYSKIVDDQTSFKIPFNTFSTDNKYFFVEEKDKETSHFLVFHTSGEPFTNGEQYMDVASVFKKHGSVHSLSEIPGWSSGQYLIVRSVNDDKSSGPSFWFGVADRSALQLTGRF